MSLPPSGWAITGAAVLAGLLGASVAMLALVIHREAVRMQELLVPWGLALAALGSVLPSLALVALGAGRAAVGAYGAAWCVVVLVLLDGRPEGDYLVAADFRGWSFLVVASLAVVVVTVRGMLGAVAARPEARADPDDLLGRRP